jgi:hypothetical protein
VRASAQSQQAGADAAASIAGDLDISLCTSPSSLAVLAKSEGLSDQLQEAGLAVATMPPKHGGVTATLLHVLCLLPMAVGS